MKMTIENGLLYVDNKRFCFAKVDDDGSKDVRSGARKVTTQYSHNHGKTLPLVTDAGWIGDDDQCYIRIGSVLGGDGPIKCHMSVSGLVARIEACEDVGKTVTLEIK